MAYRDAEAPSARGKVQLKFAKRATKIVNLFQCLIVSADATRREMFEQAAASGGWQTLLCTDAAGAETCLNRSLVQLAVIDLECPDPHALRGVVERMATRGGLLLIVCGNDGDTDEEIWVRQSGAWLYLPGVIDGGNFKLLCGEARHIAERLYRANGAERPVAALVARHQGSS
jgi:DNA-binding NtrC family response regulator